MKRGEIWYADLSPTRGSEVNKRRPVLIVSNDSNNRAASTLTVLPITSNTARVYPFEVLLPATATGLPVDSKARAQQIRTIAKERLQGSQHIGAVGPDTMQRIEAAIRLHLAL